jgi:hypothetical protein
MSTDNWTKIQAGHYRRSDGIVIQKMRHEDIVKETRRGGVDYRPHYWVVRNAKGKMIFGHSELPLGGCTFADAQEALTRREAAR